MGVMAKKTRSVEKAEEMAALLTEAGFDTKVLNRKNEDSNLVVKGVTHLGVSSSGLAYSKGRMESVPVRATKENIVAVVQAIKSLRDTVAGNGHHD